MTCCITSPFGTSVTNFQSFAWRFFAKVREKILSQFFKNGVHFQMRIGEKIQRREKEQRIAQIYTQISIIIGNWKNRLKSHGVPLSAIWPGWERLAKHKSHQKETQKQCEKNKIINLYLQDHSNQWIHFH
jgi:hypothetical protein